MSRLSDDEKRYLTDQISMLKGENERLTKYIEDYEDDTRKVLADECAPDEKHCTCVPVLRDIIAALKREIGTLKEIKRKYREEAVEYREQIDALLTGERSD